MFLSNVRKKNENLNDFILESQLHKSQESKIVSNRLHSNQREESGRNGSHSKRPSDQVWDSKQFFWSPRGTSTRSGSVDFDILAHLLTRIWAWAHSEVFAEDIRWRGLRAHQDWSDWHDEIRQVLNDSQSMLQDAWRISESGSNLVKAPVSLKRGERQAYCPKEAHCDRCTGFATIHKAGSVFTYINGDSGCSSNGRKEHVGQNLLHVQTSMQHDISELTEQKINQLSNVNTCPSSMTTHRDLISRCRERKKPLLHRKIIDLKSELAVKAVVYMISNLWPCNALS